MAEKLYYDDKTIDKVRRVLDKHIDDDNKIDDIINDCFNAGILFRERAKEEVDGI